jgi:hypothetical protein
MSGGTWRIALSTHPRQAAQVLATAITLAPLESLIAYD